MSAPVITIFVRHSADCKYRGDERERRCRCKKHLRWSFNRKQFTKSAKTHVWAAAEDEKRKIESQLSGRAPEVETAPTVQTVSAAVAAFLDEKEVAEISADAQGKYKLELGRFASFAEGQGVYAVSAVTITLLTAYRKTWPKAYGSSYTRAFVQKRLRVFLRFCYNAGWLERVPAMDPVKIDEPETSPLSETEYAALLAAVPLEFVNGTAARTRAIIQLMRYTGLAVRDASTIHVTQIRPGGRDFYHVIQTRQKTKEAVCVPLQASTAEEVLAAACGAGGHLFYVPARGTEINFAAGCGQDIRKVFDRAGIASEGHMISHRLRDTFAVDLLQRGVPLEHVSKLLGHKSVVTTEKHYAKWVKGRQDLLDSIVTGTWEVTA